MGEIEKMVKDEIGKEDGANQKKRVTSEAKWNKIFGKSDDEEEFMGVDAEICHRVVIIITDKLS